MVHSVEMLRIYVETTIVSYHIGIAASHGMQFLLTWNCEHIANARRRTIVEKALKWTQERHRGGMTSGSR